MAKAKQAKSVPTSFAGGALVAARYAHVRELGRGTSGRVIEVADSAEGGAHRAMKVVPAQQAERIRWELAALVRIAHPNVARVYELLRLEEPVGGAFRLERGAMLLVEQLAQGARSTEASSRLRADGPALVRWTLGAARDAARALAAVHAAGLVHGDVKPDNLVVAPDGRAMLVDLGLARPPGVDATVAGTPAYLAPEAWLGERGVASDLWSLGATIVCWLRGTPPAGDPRSQSLAELAGRALAPERASVALPAFVPEALGRLVEALLAADPHLRPASAREVAARLDAIATDLGATVEPRDAASAGAGEAATAEERAMLARALPFVGNVRALDGLVSALAEPGVVIVRGPPGAGRSRLVREAVRQLQVARAETSGRVPTYLAAPALPSARIEHDAVVLVERGDDADEDEARALVRGASVAGVSLCVVVERNEPAAGSTAREIVIGPLAREEIAALLSAALPGMRPGATLVDAALAASGGLAGRLCRLLAVGFSGGLDPGRPSVLRSLAATDDQGGARVPERGRALAEALAVAGGAIDAGAARAVMGSERATSDAMDALVAAGVAGLDGAGRLALRLDAAAHVHDGLAPARRRALATRLAETALDPAAEGFVRNELGESARAEAALVAAIGDEQARGDAESALSLARRAWRATASNPVGALFADLLRARGRYREALEVATELGGADGAALEAEVARLTGDVARATRAAERALSSGRGTAAHARAEASSARLALDAGRIDEAARRAEALLVEIGTDASRAREASRGAEVLALARLALGDTSAALAAATTAEERARLAGDRGLEARAIAVSASALLARDDLGRAAPRYARAFELADRAGELHAAASFLVNVGVSRLELGEPGPAIDALRDGARRLAALGRERDLGRALYNLGNAAALVGDDDLGGSSLRAAREAAERSGDAAAAAYATIVLAEIATRRGRLDDARQIVADAQERAARLAGHDAAVVLSRAAAAWAALGDSGRARSALELAREQARDDSGDLVAIELGVAHVRVALGSANAAEADRVASETHPRALRAGSHEARLRATLAAAEAADGTGRADVAAQLFADARSALDALGATLGASARARLREVPAYRRAFSTAPRPEPTDGGTERWRRLASLAKRLAGERRATRLHETVLDAAIELVGAERGFLVVRSPDGELRLRAARGIGEGALDEPGLGWSRSIAARVIDSARPLSTLDAARDARLDTAASVHSLALRSVAAVPLRLGGEVRGAIYLDDRLRPGAFGEQDVALLVDLADLAALALDSASLLRAERRAARRLEIARTRLARTVDTQEIELATLRRAVDGDVFPEIIGRSDAMRRVLELVERVAHSDVPILVLGESGTGKELVARAIHDRSARRGRPFVSENCSAIPEALLESALFGHVRGAFTGAERARAGLFEAADGGTLLLDEIGEMSAGMQAKLLRAVQDGEIRAVGSDRARHVDARLVGATHRDLAEMVERGTFRQDLYYRLAVVTIRVPSLRERPEDVAPLVAHFVHKHAGGREVRVDKRALARLTTYAWPGNVRELENETQRALVLASEVIREDHLSPAVLGRELEPARDELDLKSQLEALERRLISRALEGARGNQTRAARALGVSRFGLQKMLKRLRLEA